MRKETDIMSDRDYFDDSHSKRYFPTDRAECERLERESIEAHIRQTELEYEEFSKQYNEKRQETLKRYNEQRQTKESKTSPKKKKTKRFFKELWLERSGLLQILIYILAIGWYGYTLRIIAISDINLFLKIIMIIGGLVLALFTCISLHDDE